MLRIKTSKEIAEKYSRVTPGRSADFDAGVKDPNVDWATPTIASEGTYEEGVQQAISEKRFGKGVKAKGTEHWRKKTTEVGITRWPVGVRAAADDYEMGFAKYRDAIERITLPPRYPKGDPRNIERVRAVAEALHTAKVG